MSILYFDAFSGASGDMILGSLIHLGLDFNYLQSELAKLPLKGYKISCHPKKMSSIEGIKFNVEYHPETKHRHLKDIQEIITHSSLDSFVKQKSIEIFEVIAEAEAKIHGTTKDKIHFHEVGAMDSIIDIVGSCIALYSIGTDKIMSSPLPLGRGFVDCAHGKMPLPAPATLEILKDFPCYGVDREGEFVTPTGAAILKCWVDEVREFPNMSILKSGYGSGTAEREIPNMLRVVMGEEIVKETLKKKLLLIETNIDDLNPEILAHVSERLFEKGALDVYTTAIAMKKGRNGIKLSVLLDSLLERPILDILFRETTTIGLRKMWVEREELQRREIIFESSFGAVPIKESYYNKDRITYKPEFECLKKISIRKNIPLRNLYNLILSEYKQKK